jgi:hypothetical protein
VRAAHSYCSPPPVPHDWRSPPFIILAGLLRIGRDCSRASVLPAPLWAGRSLGLSRLALALLLSFCLSLFVLAVNAPGCLAEEELLAPPRPPRLWLCLKATPIPCPRPLSALSAFLCLWCVPRESVILIAGCRLLACVCLGLPPSARGRCAWRKLASYPARIRTLAGRSPSE